MKKFIGVTLLALALIFGCIKGAIWQYDRYQLRHSTNEVIRKNFAAPSISEAELRSGFANPDSIAWRTIKLSGSFDPAIELLVRNRYHDGKYGFGVITLFTSSSGYRYWVDRGWVQAGKDALTPPTISPVTNAPTEIEARVRMESLENQVGGSVFAIPNSKSDGSVVKWDKQASVQAEPVYFDLIKTNNPSFTPRYPTLLPSLSDGPHLAYSFQWALFAGLVIFAWFLVIREEFRARRNQSAKA